MSLVYSDPIYPQVLASSFVPVTKKQYGSPWILGVDVRTGGGVVLSGLEKETVINCFNIIYFPFRLHESIFKLTSNEATYNHQKKYYFHLLSIFLH